MQLMLLRTSLDLWHLVLLSLSHSLSTVPWFLLLSRKLES